MADLRLGNQAAIVTGGASGIGRATALRFATEGASVLVVDRDLEGAEETVRLGDNAPGKLLAMELDVTAAEAPPAIVVRCRNELGAPTALVNNAGIGGALPVHEMDDKALDRFNDVNFRSVFRASRAFLSDCLADQRPACIVNISSIFALRGFPSSSVYAANKAALIGLTQSMAADYGPHEIRINAIAPGLIRTAMTQSRIDDNGWFLRTMIAGTPLGRVGRPEDVAAAIAFLCSDDAAFITGQVLAVDGGWSTTKSAPMPGSVQE